MSDWPSGANRCGSLPRSTVFFDWGGTLAHVPEGSLGPTKVWARALAESGETRGEEQIRAALGAADREVGGLIYAYLGRTGEFWELFDARVMDALGLGTRRAEVQGTVERTFEDPRRVRLYLDSRRTLVALRSRGYRTGLISNHHDGLLRDLRHHELGPLFDSVTYSQQAGAEKPDPAIFSLALQRAGCRPVDAVHVGDTIEADVAGARGSGLAPVWVDRRRSDRSAGCPTISTLDELLTVLESGR
jgi:putative hydrolase of the HAD superfamily